MRASGYARAASDWYVEPAWVVQQLLDAESAHGGFPGLSWDPACGGGNIPSVAANAGCEIMGSDLIDRAKGRFGVLDFLATKPKDFRVKHVISNPPYGLIEPFVRHAVSIASSKVAILARLAFITSQKRRDGLFRDHPISRIWVCSQRPSMPPGDADIPASGGAIDYAWFVWDRGHVGPTHQYFLGSAA